MARVLLLAGHETMEPILSAAGHAIVRDSSLPHDLVIASSPMPSHGRPVIVFTTPGDVAARIQALRSGASDALDARFATSQIAARVDAVALRAAPDQLSVNGCVLDLAACVAVRGPRSVALSPREVDIVRWLHRHSSRIVSRAELLEHVWGVSPDNTTRAVDVAISALRAKIEEDPRKPAIIVSTKGAGYRWMA